MSLITISLGSNINPSENLKKALDEISKFSKIKIISKIYKSKSVGFEGDDFLNQVIVCEVNSTFHFEFNHRLISICSSLNVSKNTISFMFYRNNLFFKIVLAKLFAISRLPLRVQWPKSLAKLSRK